MKIICYTELKTSLMVISVEFKLLTEMNVQNFNNKIEVMDVWILKTQIFLLVFVHEGY